VSKDFVAYHKTDERGEPERFTAKTRKKAEAQKSHGHRVWLVSGEGTPRRYFLEQTFIVDEMARNPLILACQCTRTGTRITRIGW
jgi:phosphoserine phosphatase